MESTENSKSSRSEISLPLVDGRRLGEFIADLLGQRRSLERSFSNRRFEIDFNWLLNLDLIIAQRIAAQHTASLVSFSARIYFSNGKILTLEDYKAFRNFDDISTELSVGVTLKWTYLIQFPSKEIPDKEEISFAAFTDYTAIVKKPGNEKKLRSILTFAEDTERLGYNIEFTDITWGDDVSTHINNYIMSRTEKLSSWRQSLRGANRTTWLPLSLALGMFTSLWSFVSSIQSETTQLLKQYGDLSQYIKHLTSLNDKIDLLISLAVIRIKVDLPVIALFRPFTYIVVLSLVFYLSTIRKKSYILINEYSKRLYKKYDRNHDFVIGTLLIGILISILAGVFANSVYDYLKGTF